VLLLPGGELYGSASGEVKDIKEQDHIFLASIVFKADLVALTGRQAEVRCRTSHLHCRPCGARHSQAE